MEIKLKTIDDLKLFRRIWRTVNRNDKDLYFKSDAKVVVSANLLSNLFIQDEMINNRIISQLQGLVVNTTFESKNFVEEWIKEQIQFFKDEKSEEEIRKDCLATVKKELTQLKSEEDLNTVNMADMNYNFLYRIYDCYPLEPEDIINKIEKDLAEFEVPVNADEEPIEVKAN